MPEKAEGHFICLYLEIQLVERLTTSGIRHIIEKDAILPSSVARERGQGH